MKHFRVVSCTRILLMTPYFFDSFVELWNLWKEPTPIILSIRFSKTYLFIELSFSSSLHTLPIKNRSSWWNFFTFVLLIAFFNASVLLQYWTTLPLINNLNGSLRSAEKHLSTKNSRYQNVTCGVHILFTEGFPQAYRSSIQPSCFPFFIFDRFTATCFLDFLVRSISAWQHCPPRLTKDLILINVIHSVPGTKFGIHNSFFIELTLCRVLKKDSRKRSRGVHHIDGNRADGFVSNSCFQQIQHSSELRGRQRQARRRHWWQGYFACSGSSSFSLNLSDQSMWPEKGPWRRTSLKYFWDIVILQHQTLLKLQMLALWYLRAPSKNDDLGLNKVI